MTVKELIEHLKTFDENWEVSYMTKRTTEDGEGYRHRVNSWEPLEDRNVFTAKIGGTVFIGDK